MYASIDLGHGAVSLLGRKQLDRDFRNRLLLGRSRDRKAGDIIDTRCR